MTQTDFLITISSTFLWPSETNGTVTVNWFKGGFSGNIITTAVFQVFEIVATTSEWLNRRHGGQ